MIDRSTLFQRLADGACVITANNRLAVHLQRDYLAHSGQSFLAKSDCLPYQLFLQQRFNEHCKEKATQSPPLLLSSPQLHHLWQQILKQQPDYFMNKGMIHAVEEAWTRCLQWQIDINSEEFQASAQTRLFQKWVQRLQQRLQQIPAICDNQLADYLITHQIPLPPKTYIWYCFDDFTPQQRALQDYMSAQGHTVLHSDLPLLQTTPEVYEAADEQDQYQQLILWLQTQLVQQDQRVAVVVPNLQTEGKSLQRLLKKELPAASFDISLGESLGSYDLVSHALCWLELANNQLSSHQAKLLLHSPYLIAAKTEISHRARVVQENPCIDEDSFQLRRIMPVLQQSSPQLAQALHDLQAYPASASPAQWIELFCQRLQTLGFPGEYPLNSVNYQCYQRFIALLEEFRHLHVISPQLDADEALSAVRQLADTTIFQPQKTAAQIQILGLLEASGCVYDSLWITGMTDECLPQKARLSAFIPVTLQQTRHMPHASPSRELMLASRQINRFRVSASHCVFSYPRFTQDKPNLVSPLLNESTPYLPLEKPQVEKLAVLESYQESYHLPPQAQEAIKGGSALLANQAKCPFRALAAHRLHAANKPLAMEGLNHLERGQIIHQIMELIWQTLQNQQALLTIEETTLQHLIADAINTALMPYNKLNKNSFPPLIQQLEHQRLRQLVDASLQWERSRPDFSIEALEKTYTLQLGGIDFSLRVDRMDKTTEGYQWVIDYKSGVPQNLPWKEERPREPQLLLYALLEESINTLVFATLKNGQIQTKGLSEEKHEGLDIAALKKEENWREQRQQWQQRLEALANEFSAGHCPPTPINSSVCQLCDFQSLCRFSADAVSSGV